jgi:hypothetical protein
MTKQYIPARPPGPSILAGGSDPDIDQIAGELMASSAPQQQQPGPQVNDPDIDVLANEAMGVNGQLEQPLQPSGKAGLKAAPSAGPSIKRKSASGPTQLTPPPPPVRQPWEVAGQQLIQGGQQFINGAAAQFDRGLGRVANAAGQIPIAGPMGAGMIQQANAAQQEYARDPIGSGIAAVANAPRGLLGVVDALGNTVTRQLSEWGPSVHKNGPLAAPFNLAGAYDQIPGMRTLQQAYPGQSGTGQAAGASAIPAHVPIPIANPAVRGAIQGGIGGQFLGAVASTGEQAKRGPINYGKAAVEGLPVAALGAGLGAGIGKVIGKVIGGGPRPKGGAPEPTKPPQPKSPEAKPSEPIVMKDGSKFADANAVTAALRSDATPPEVKAELRDLMKQKDADFAGAGLKERPASRVNFADLGSDPTITDVQTRIKETMEAAQSSADVEQIKADTLKFIQRNYRGTGDVRPKLIEYAEATAKQQSLRTSAAEYAAKPPAPISDKFQGGISRATDSTGVGREPAAPPPDIKENTSNPLKPAELDPNDPIAKDYAFQEEMAKLFPAATQRAGSIERGIFNPRELTDAQLDTEIVAEHLDGRTGAGKDNNALAAEAARRQWVRENHPERQDWPTEEQHQAEYPDSAITHEETPAPAEPAYTPTTVSPEVPRPPRPAERTYAEVLDAQARDPRFGMLRRFNQGTNPAVEVKYPTELEEYLSGLAANPQKLREKWRADAGKDIADHLGITEDELWSFARKYHDDLKALARDQARMGGNYIDAPRAQPKPKEVLPPANAAPEAAAEVAESVAAPAAEPAAATPGERFTYQKNTEKPGGYVDLIDNHTGEVISSSKRTEAQAAALAAKYNDLAVNAPDKLEGELNRGSKNFLDFKKSADPERARIIEKGKALPADHELAEPLGRVAEAKHAFDEARARYEAAADAFYKHIKETQGTTSKRARKYIQDVEDLTATARKAGSDELTIEVNSANKLEPKAPKFQRGMSPDEAYSMVENLHSEMAAREAELSEARAGIKDSFLKSDLGSVNIPNEKGTVNVRAVPKRGTELNAVADEITGPVPDKEYIDRKISTVRTVAKKRGIRTRRGQRGSIKVVVGKKAAPPPKTVEENLAEGSAESKEVSDLANDRDAMTSLFTLRNTFDIVKEVSNDLHNEMITGIGKEALASHGIKFEPGDAPLVEASRALEPWTIREGGTPEVDLSKFSDEQLNALATARSVRQRMADAVRDELTKFDEEYGSLDNMPNRVKTQYTTLEQLEQSLSGYSPRSGTSEGGILGGIRNAFYDYIFKWNAAYHALNLVDPFIVGSARVGINRVMAAKALIHGDAAVKAFVKGVGNETAIQALRKETNIDFKTPKGVKAGKLTKLKQGLAKVQSKLPDLPSERWNFEDSFLAGVIERGDRIGYEGKGTQYAKDLATGKLSPEEQIKAFSDAMNIAQEITGSGSFGLNKDIVQRIGVGAKAISLFTSQPLRQTRILSDIITKDMKVDPVDASARLLAFAAATTLFGGRALLPKESDLLEMVPSVRPFFRGVQDFLDKGKLFENVPIIGRDLTDKLRYSMIPFLGGVQQNMLAAEMEKFIRTFQGQKWDDLAKASLFWTLSRFAGGGGLEAAKATKNFGAAAEGDKKITAYPSISIGGGAPAGSKKFSQITGKKYDKGQAVADSLLPGVDKRIGKFIKQARRDKIDKTK